jgi:hypothetical protein
MFSSKQIAFVTSGLYQLGDLLLRPALSLLVRTQYAPYSTMKAQSSLLIFASFIILICAAVLDTSSVLAVYNGDNPSVQRDATQHLALDKSSRDSYHFSGFLPCSPNKLVARGTIMPLWTNVVI